ncbi:LPXTG cell wall anchor domain-containing protein [Lactobacillaceae bacterium Melli_B4]
MKYEGFTPKTFKYQWTPITVSVLSALTLAGAVTTTANAQDNSSNVQNEQSNDVTLTLVFKSGDGQTFNTKTIAVPKNSTYDYGKDIPDGYTMGNDSTSIKIGEINTNLSVTPAKATPVNNNVTYTINFTYNGQTVGTKTYTVAKNSEFDYGNDIPDGYTMNGASTVINTGTENINYTIGVAKKPAVSNDAKLTIHFTNDNQEVGTVTRTVAKNSDYDFSKDVPAGYNVGTLSTVQHVGDGDFNLSIGVLKNEAQQPTNDNVTMTANFKANGQTVGTKTYTVAKNSEIDYSKDLPAGYHNATTNSTYKAGDGNGNFDVNVIKDASQQPEHNDVTANFIFKYDGQTISTKAYTAAKNSEIDYGSAIPAGYKLNNQSTKFNVGDSDSTNTFELSKVDTETGTTNYTPYFTPTNTSTGSDAPIIFYSAPSSTASSAASSSASASSQAQSSSVETSMQSSASSNAQSNAIQSSATSSAGANDYSNASNSSSTSHASATNNAHHKKHLGTASNKNHKHVITAANNNHQHATKQIDYHATTTNSPRTGRETATTTDQHATTKHQSNANQSKLPQTGESNVAKSTSLIGLLMVAIAGLFGVLFKRSK